MDRWHHIKEIGQAWVKVILGRIPDNLTCSKNGINLPIAFSLRAGYRIEPAAFILTNDRNE